MKKIVNIKYDVINIEEINNQSHIGFIIDQKKYIIVKGSTNFSPEDFINLYEFVFDDTEPKQVYFGTDLEDSIFTTKNKRNFFTSKKSCVSYLIDSDHSQIIGGPINVYCFFSIKKLLEWFIK